jgi:hypothetical protein
MSHELADALIAVLAAVVGWIAQRVRMADRAAGRIELELGTSRKSQGERLGVLEDRVSRLEGAISVGALPLELVPREGSKHV